MLKEPLGFEDNSDTTLKWNPSPSTSSDVVADITSAIPCGYSVHYQSLDRTSNDELSTLDITTAQKSIRVARKDVSIPIGIEPNRRYYWRVIPLLEREGFNTSAASISTLNSRCIHSLSNFMSVDDSVEWWYVVELTMDYSDIREDFDVAAFKQHIAAILQSKEERLVLMQLRKEEGTPTTIMR